MEDIMKKIVFLVVLVIVLAFASCDNFFGKSWGTPREYDVSKIEVNAGNVAEWVDRAIGNPELAAAITDKIIEELDKASADDKAILMEAGINLAVESSGMGESMLTHAADILGDMDNLDPDDVTELLRKMRGDFNSKGGRKAAKNIATIANKGLKVSNDGIPTFDDGYANSAKPGDVAEAIMVLVLGELGDGDLDDWGDIENQYPGLEIDDTLDPPMVKALPGASSSELALAAYLNLIVTGGSKFDDNDLTKTIRKAFFENTNGGNNP